MARASASRRGTATRFSLGRSRSRARTEQNAGSVEESISCGGIYQLVKGFQAVLGQQVTVGQLAAAELHPGQGVSMGQQAEAVQVLEGDGLPGRQGVAQRHGDAEAVLQIRPYPRCRTSTP